ncbi:MAG TPA: hypothetical protein VFM69_02310, partial [Pricia sp.]|nr:hypothetical protein [Pricia sp.]
LIHHDFCGIADNALPYLRLAIANENKKLQKTRASPKITMNRKVLDIPYKPNANFPYNLSGMRFPAKMTPVNGWGFGTVHVKNLKKSQLIVIFKRKYIKL